MVFSSFVFLFAFLPVFLAAYFLAPSRVKNAIVLAASYIFYAWGAPAILPLFFLSCLIDFFLGQGIERSVSPKRKKLFLFCSLAVNLGGLFYFKYANFFVGEFNRLLSAMGADTVVWTSVALPVGISFFTFHKISYIVDIYRGKVVPARNFINYALYIALFPQLVAGPIIRYYDISSQIERREHSLDNVLYGAYRFCLGLAKKVLVADALGAAANHVFDLPPTALSTSYAWLGILCYAFQIYFDFSGYSDMAIGLGRIMGFHFLENFNLPYISQNFTEFWRRWHISLSNWMRDYLYIPLGGNRASPFRTYLNLWIVFLLSGLWHGANWSFVIWGIYHGLFLSFDKWIWLKKSKPLGRFSNTLLTFFFVLIGWVFFRSETLAGALLYLQHMFDFVHFGSVPVVVPRAMIIHNRGLFVLGAAAVISFVPMAPGMQRLSALKDKLPETALVCGRFVVSGAFLVLSVLALASTDFSPFIYFRF